MASCQRCRTPKGADKSFALQGNIRSCSLEGRIFSSSIMPRLLLLSALLAAGLCGCDQRQGQMLDLFQKQLQEKDKQIEELNQKVNELDRRNADLESQVSKG